MKECVQEFKTKQNLKLVLLKNAAAGLDENASDTGKHHIYT